MPINKTEKKRYPENWPQIRQSILDRAQNCCEGSTDYPNCRAANGKNHPDTNSKVVLTVSHLDHTPENCDPSNLKAFCQRCHLVHDKYEHGRKAAITKKKNQQAAKDLQQKVSCQENTVAMVAIDKLIAYKKNPRKNDHAVEKVASAIREFGFRVPVLIQKDNLVIDGHLRIKAAKKAGLHEVPVMYADDMTQAQIKAFRISVNKVAELASWDDNLLIEELNNLQQANIDLEITGFDLDEIDLLMKETKTTLKKIKPEKAPPEMTWLLVGIPLINYGDIQEIVKEISLVPRTIVQTTNTDSI